MTADHASAYAMAAAAAQLLLLGVVSSVAVCRSSAEARPRRIVALAYCALCAVHQAWRIATLASFRGAWPERAVAVAVWIVELPLILGSARMLLLLVGRSDRRSQADAGARWWLGAGAPAPKVAILIPTFNEPESVIERSVIGALRQRHPSVSVWVLDDGDRPAVRALAAGLGALYHARPRHDGGKAGNLSAGLAFVLQSEPSLAFLAVMDADFIAAPDLIPRTLALMTEPDVALVQTPQAYFNPDPLQLAFWRGRALADEQRLAFDLLLPARDAAGMAHCCGTSYLVRVAALRDVGGFATSFALEDIAVSVLLRRRGWRTIYLNEILSYGMAPETLTESIGQRQRWAVGCVQIARMILADWRRGRIWKRWRAAEPIVRWVYLTPLRVALFMAPVLHCLVGAAVYPGRSADALAVALPLFVAYRAALAWISDGRRVPIVHDVSLLVCAGAVTRALFVGVRGGAPDSPVTRKGLTDVRWRIHGAVLAWNGAAALALAASAALQLRSVATDGAFATLHLQLWTLYALITFAVTASLAFERPRRRAAERFDAGAQPVGIESGGSVRTAALRDLSTIGAAVTADGPLPVGASVVAHLVGVGAVSARVVRRLPGGGAALSFDATPGQRRALVETIYSPRYVRPVQQGRVADVLVAVAGHLRDIAAGGLQRLADPAPAAPRGSRP